jgi:hypothetical protein
VTSAVSPTVGLAILARGASHAVNYYVKSARVHSYVSSATNSCARIARKGPIVVSAIVAEGVSARIVRIHTAVKPATSSFATVARPISNAIVASSPTARIAIASLDVRHAEKCSVKVAWIHSFVRFVTSDCARIAKMGPTAVSATLLSAWIARRCWSLAWTARRCSNVRNAASPTAWIVRQVVLYVDSIAVESVKTDSIVRSVVVSSA